MLKPHIIKTDLDGATILLDTKKNEYYALNETAMEWMKLIEANTVETMTYQLIANQYDVPVHQVFEDISLFLQDLRRKGWVE